ncbi:glutathione S-transferase family protein [Haliea sp. E17]|uniref:glutathione S-transferase family protein n=1 Tax=Haliea sp. E17 TaxID=3401576 RepID=UPI003AAB5D85
MKLLNLNHSPYATRIRMQIRHKELPVELVAPDVPLRTPEFLARYPLGKVPVLVLDDGRSVGESVAIMRYLEAAFPEPSLLPANPEQVAFDCMLAGYADSHLAPALFPLFGAMLGRGSVDTAAQLAEVEGQLKKLENLLAQWQVGDARLTVGSICLSTVIAFTLEICGRLERPAVLEGLPHSERWWQSLQSIPVVEMTLDEMFSALQAFLQK